MTFAEQVVQLHDRLDAAGFPHAFGGALALAFLVDARATVDVDVNVFVPAEAVDGVIAALTPLGYRRERPPGEVLPIAGIRLVGDERFAVDLFPSLSEGYAEIARRIVEHPFGADRRRLPFLSAEDLVVFKLSFNRAKDWVDLQAVVVAWAGLDLDYVERKVVELRGPTMYPRVARLRSLRAD